MDENNKDEQEIVSEELDDSVVAEESAQATIKKLRDKIKTLEKEKEEYLTGWQRAKADNVNSRRLADEERKNTIQFANRGLIEDLLPVLASFDLAFSNKEAWEKVDKNWRAGVEYIYSQLKTALENNGLEEIDSLGAVYNPIEHEAVETVLTQDKAQDGKLVQVLSKGFKLNGKTISVPKVKVAEYKQL